MAFKNPVELAKNIERPILYKNQNELDTAFGEYIKANPIQFRINDDPKANVVGAKYLNGEDINNLFSAFLKSANYDGDEWDFRSEYPKLSLLRSLDKYM